MHSDLLARKRAYFLLWRPGIIDPAPSVCIGVAEGDAVRDCRELPLAPLDGFDDLWGVAATDCDLRDGQIYWYWFKVRSTDPYVGAGNVVLCTDPLAWTVDRRYPAPAPEGEGAATGQPAAVVLYRDGALLPCDPQGQTVDWGEERALPATAPNNRLVIYELPTRWTHRRTLGTAGVGDGTFRDVLALLSGDAPDLPDVPVYAGRGHLEALGVNALELLPPADSEHLLEWGYSTANYFAADYDLGRPDPTAAPTATSDLVQVIRACHAHGMRFFVDMVMAFARGCSYRQINFPDFFVQAGVGDPEEVGREGFGGDLWKFNYWVEGYHPQSGERAELVPAREFMKLYLLHWMDVYRVDGLRLDSVNNINNEDFLEEFKDLAHEIWRQRGGGDERFLVVGEELSVPLRLVSQRRLDALWNERFKQIARQVILGRAAEGCENFEQSVRALIDCRTLGFGDEAQAVNYLTSHDTGGVGNERLFDWLRNNGVVQAEERMKLAFTCLLTAVGTPMILAGDEFAEQQDLDQGDERRGEKNKQIDPIDFSRMEEPWRQRLFAHVARLVRLRTTADALAVNDVSFIHCDVAEDKQVLAWQRGRGDDLVVVVANFSDYATPQPEQGGAEYRIANWPAAPEGRHWCEVTRDRPVPDEWAGRELLVPWTARVYQAVAPTPSD